MVFRRLLVLLALLASAGRLHAAQRSVADGRRPVACRHPDPAARARARRRGGLSGCGAAGLCRSRRPEGREPVRRFRTATASSCSTSRWPMRMRPSGYVMVTRGLLALLDDEAELAAALGHEVGHVVQRHASQRARQRQSVLDAAVDAATSTGSITVGRSVARDGLLALRRYSREQELEADRIGVAMLVKARLSRQRHGEPDRQAAPPVAARSAAHGRAARFDRSAQHDLDPSGARRAAHRPSGRQRRHRAGRVPSHGLSRRHQRHVGRRSAPGRVRARQSLSPSRAEAGLRGAPRLPPVQRH